jgi:hypothetical protein
MWEMLVTLYSQTSPLLSEKRTIKIHSNPNTAPLFTRNLWQYIERSSRPKVAFN